MTGISFVVPVFNGRRHLRRVLVAISREAQGRPHEILVVDDGSSDGSVALIERLRAPALRAAIRVVPGPGRGAAAAINTGIHEARFPFVAQIDQDVVLRPGWLDRVLAAMTGDAAIAAAVGRYTLHRRAGFWPRMAGRDLDLRYGALANREIDHAGTGNTLYRKSALHHAGLFNDNLGYGYDNDLSYRLRALGYRLVFCPDATADHFWRDSFTGYLTHQFGVGYGRLDLVNIHRPRVTGDTLSGILMIAHAPLMLIALLSAAASCVAVRAGSTPVVFARAAGLLIAFLAIERTIAGVRARRLTGDVTALAFPAAHFARDVAWAAALVIWGARTILGRGTRPSDSMRRSRDRVVETPPARSRVLIIVPAFNEAESLPLVIADIRRERIAADVLVVNDASTDRTRELLPTLGVLWLTLSERLGVGGALRAGMKFARQRGYAIVGRMDGDGQHRAADLARLLLRVQSGRADAASGSRFLRGRAAAGARGASIRLLSACLTAMTRRRVTDPTSGLWMFGPRAVRLLETHHPGGYPEPELRLLLARHGLTVHEVPIEPRERHAGRTSLTPARALTAFARTALALIVSPLRRGLRSAGD